MDMALVIRALKKELLCPICKLVLLDPVTSPCGRTWCRVCFPGKASKELPTNLRLKNVLSLLLRMQPQPPVRFPPNHCALHMEPLLFFCWHDWEHACIVCKYSEEHRRHTLIPFRSQSLE
ncbi:E3 ubiquitin-protein ligase TRIM17-like [Sminthopsis crassicaudata]|uniref:E3 ubiquitin-protein ligase TRIM17-like n=1 Tax=Sminthopsis crassicaudata TaxID=9301 RepID=UPI003D69C00D